jgi:hypothetical protein
MMEVDLQENLKFQKIDHLLLEDENSPSIKMKIVLNE